MQLHYYRLWYKPTLERALDLRQDYAGDSDDLQP